MTREASPPELLVASDVHLGPHTPTHVDEALARLIAQHPGHELVLNGDIFDLSLAPRSAEVATLVRTLITRTRALPTALRTLLSQGSKVSLVVGNHDAELLHPGSRAALLEALSLTQDAPLEVHPWFIQRGPVHLEHGHLYDPDNAPTHPLVSWQQGTEPLGIALTRRFLVPSGATYFAHAHQTTPLKGLLDVFAKYRSSAPRMIFQYFHAAIPMTLEARAGSAHERLRRAERDLGRERLCAFAEAAGLTACLLEELLRRAPAPTHHDFSRTFMRLYFDRVLSVVMGGLGAALLLPLSRTAALGLAAVATTYLAQSVTRQGSRYHDGPRERLRVAAAEVREATGAELVVFGHTHHEDSAPGYLNSGSFAFGRGGGSYLRLRGAERLIP